MAALCFGILFKMYGNVALWVAILLTAFTIGLTFCAFGPIARWLDLRFPRDAIYVGIHAALSAAAWLFWFFG